MIKRMYWLAVISFIMAFFSGCQNQRNSEQAFRESEEVTVEVDGLGGGKDIDLVKIGVLIPMSGNNTQVGVEVRALCQLFEDVINQTVEINLPFNSVEGLPKLKGARVEFVYGDLSTKEIAASETERLINEEGVIGITGTMSSEMTKVVAQVTEKYHIILLSEGTSVSLLEAGYKYYGRTYPNDASFVKDTFEYLKYLNISQKANISSLAIVCEDSEFGNNIAQVLRENAMVYEFNIVEDISYNAKVTDVKSEVLRLKKSNPDVVIMSSYLADSLLYITSFKEDNYFPKMLFGQRGGFTSSEFVSTLNEDANYAFTTSRWNSDFNNEIAQELILKYKEEYCQGVDLISDVLSAGWDAYLIAIMVNQGASIDPEVLRQVMYNGIILNPEHDPTGLPGYKYGEDGQNSVSSAIILQIFDGRLITVYPERFAYAQGIYPAPSWEERQEKDKE